MTTCAELQSSDGMANKDDINVAGKNIKVMLAMVFIDVLSCLLAAAMLFESLAISILSRLSRWLIRLRTWRN